MTTQGNRPRTRYVRVIDLTTFERAYLECALWASTDDDGEPLDAVHTIDDLSPDALADMLDDCADFRDANADDLDDAWDQGVDDELAGHDFWLTRNHHGAGFWDRGIGETGRRLTDAAHAYGSCDLYAGDDGMIHVA